MLFSCSGLGTKNHFVRVRKIYCFGFKFPIFVATNTTGNCLKVSLKLPAEKSSSTSQKPPLVRWQWDFCWTALLVSMDTERDWVLVHCGNCRCRVCVCACVLASSTGCHQQHRCGNSLAAGTWLDSLRQHPLRLPERKTSAHVTPDAHNVETLMRFKRRRRLLVSGEIITMVTPMTRAEKSASKIRRRAVRRRRRFIRMWVAQVHSSLHQSSLYQPREWAGQSTGYITSEASSWCSRCISAAAGRLCGQESSSQLQSDSVIQHRGRR